MGSAVQATISISCIHLNLPMVEDFQLSDLGTIVRRNFKLYNRHWSYLNMVLLSQLEFVSHCLLSFQNWEQLFREKCVLNKRCEDVQVFTGTQLPAESWASARAGAVRNYLPGSIYLWTQREKWSNFVLKATNTTTPSDLSEASKLLSILLVSKQ